MKNYYKILGLNEYSTKEEIIHTGNVVLKLGDHYIEKRFANKELGKDYTQEEFDEVKKIHDEIVEAYQVLSDDYKKSVYDAQLRKYIRKKRAEKNKNAFGKMINSFKDVRDEEKKNPLFKRHQDLNKTMENKLHKNVSSKTGEIVYKMINGTVHITCEFLHQLRKLGYICEDPIPKYVFRNRNLVATALAVTLITSSVGANAKENNAVPEITTSVTQEVTTEEAERPNRVHIVYGDPTMQLVGYYQVEDGDTLSDIANRTGLKVKDIQDANSRLDDKIYSGEMLKIPYIVDREKLDYYTQIVEAKGITCAELAKVYHTDESTIKMLNREAIAYTNNGYIIISDTAVVPNFVTVEEFQTIKAQEETQKTLK